MDPEYEDDDLIKYDEKNAQPGECNVTPKRVEIVQRLRALPTKEAELLLERLLIQAYDRGYAFAIRCGANY